ncbi:unnamed protein product [Chrysoparadoxa australica]
MKFLGVAALALLSVSRSCLAFTPGLLPLPTRHLCQQGPSLSNRGLHVIPLRAQQEGDMAFRAMESMGSAMEVVGKSTRWTVAGTVALTLLVRRDASTLSFVVGALANAVLSKVLKRCINEARPAGSELADPGMPSSHAMSLFFIGTYAVLALESHNPAWWPIGTAATQAALAAYAVSAAAWRVAAGYHTGPQIVVGGIVGTLDAVAWRLFANGPVVAWLEATMGEKIPLEAVIGVCVLAALSVGSVERKIASLLTKLRQD